MYAASQLTSQIRSISLKVFYALIAPPCAPFDPKRPQRRRRGTWSLRQLMLPITAIVWCALLPQAVVAQGNIQHTSKSPERALRSDLKINPSTHGLELEIPLGNFPGRAGHDLPVTISYSSKLWRAKFAHYFPDFQVTGVAMLYSEHSRSGWTSSVGVPVIDAEPQNNEFYSSNGSPVEGCTVGGPNSSTCCFIDRIMARMPDGSSHELRSTDTPICYNSSFVPSPVPGDDMYAVDSSRLRYKKSTKELFLPDGSRYILNPNSPQYIDRNGNVLSTSGGQWTDTLGRQISSPLGGSGTYNYALPGVGGPINYTFVWRNLSAAGVLSSGQQLSYITNMGCPQGPSGSPSLFSGCIVNNHPFDPQVLYQIVLPTGQSYTFNYNAYGEINKVTYPTGGYERYAYGFVDAPTWVGTPYSNGQRGVVGRFVSVSGTGTDEVLWQYSSGEGGSMHIDRFILREIAPKADGSPNGTRTERQMHREGNSTFGYGGVMGGMPYEERVFDSAGQMLRRKLTQWVSSGSGTAHPFAQHAKRNPRVAKEVEIILDTGGGPALTKTTTYQYDTTYQFSTGLNVTSTTEYGFVTVDQSTAQTGAIELMPLGPLARITEKSYDLESNQLYRDRNLVGLVTSTRIKDAGQNIVAQSAISYDEVAYPLISNGTVPGWSDPGTTKRGNPTTTASWLNTTGTYLQTHAQYDQCGSLRNSWDAKGNQSQVEYSSTFAFAYPTLTRTAVPDPTGQYGSTTALVSTNNYDFNTGLVTSQTDANGQTTSYTYADPLNRIKTVSSSDGGLTTFNYNDVPGALYVETVTKQTATQNIHTFQFFDPLRRPNRSFQGVGGGNYITADKQYDALGRVKRLSNPYLSTGSASPINPSGNWTTSSYDALGRVTSVTTPDGAQVGTVYSGSTSGTLGLTVTVTDQMLKKRKSVSDALGRLREVYEDPTGLNYLTSYSYDTLGNLTQVSQDTQSRYFMYDSLKRLIRARNPEQGVHASLNFTDPLTGNTQWSCGYQYDANGNLTQKTDARGVVGTYGYDALNRNVFVTYSDGTPQIIRVYDGAVNGKGRFWYHWTSAADALQNAHTAIDTYDTLGRVKNWRQHFWVNNNWSQGYYMSRNYDLAGHVTLQSYPSGRTASYAYDDAGRTSSFSGNLGDGVTRTYSTGIIYSPFGGMAKEQFGTDTPLHNKSFYNSRGQLAEIRVGTTYNTPGDSSWNRGAIINHYSNAPGAWGATGGGPDNNGNLKRQEHWIPKEDQPQPTIFEIATQEYAYDNLNRLQSVQEGSLLRQEYVYDRYGNRTIHQTNTWGSGINKKDFTVNTANNRLGVPGGQSGAMSYDNAGNLTTDTYTGAGSRTYDAENRMTQAWGGNNQQQFYTYNADGQRVRRKVDGLDTWQIYGMAGELLAEYPANGPVTSPQKEYGYRNGQLLISADSASPVQGPTANAVTDFSATQNPNTPWTYGWRDSAGNNFTAFASNNNVFGLPAGMNTWYQVNAYNFPALIRNGTGTSQSYYGATQPTTLLNLYPGGYGEKGVVRWTAQTAGTVSIQGRFEGLDTTTTNVAVRHYTGSSNTTLFSGNINGYGNQAPFALTRAVAAGETIEFQVDYNGNIQHDSTGLAATITPQAATASLQWLVTDQLGTPRMIFDKTGSFGTVKRHDYLPFGEELYAGQGVRTTLLGYTGDTVRQKFTSKERDNETELDYFLARYYSSRQGRFTSPDEFKGGPEELFGEVDPHDPLFYADMAEPQSLNKYQYCLNNPPRYIDPNGHQTQAADALKLGATLTLAGPHPVVKGIGVGIIFGVVVEKTIGWDNVAAGAKKALDWARTGNTSADPWSPGLSSSERMGQAMMEDSNNSQGGAQGQGQNGAQQPGENAQQGPEQKPDDKGTTGGRNQPKERTVEGAQNQLEGLQKEKEKKPYIRTNKSEQNLDNEIREQYIKKKKNP